MSGSALSFCAIVVVLGGAMFFGLHGAACAMHMAAVERLWAHQPDARDRYQWSYAYCSVVSAPIRWVLP